MSPLRSSLAFCAWTCPLVIGGPVMAQDNFYAGKRINIVVGSTVGGGQDAYGRLLERHLGRFIPGKPTIIVQNLAGAGGLAAVQSLDVSAPKDGTTMATFSPGLLLQSMITPEEIKVKFSEFAWLGSIGQNLSVCFMWGTNNVKTWEDMLKADQVIMPDTARGTATIEQKIIRHVFGVKLKPVYGYPGANEKRLALERGEVDGDCGIWTSLPPEWLRDKKINVVIRFQEQVSSGLPESVPYSGNLTSDPEKKKLLALFNAPSEIGRPYMMSKAVPAERVKILREAFDKTMKDEQFLADAVARGLLVSPIPGDKIQDMLQVLYAAPPNLIESARKVLGL